MTDKRRYYKLDDIGFLGTQEKRTPAQIKADAVRTANIFKAMKEGKQSKRTIRPGKATRVK